MKNLMLLVCILLSIIVADGQRDLRKEHPFASKTPIEAARIFGPGIISTREYELTTTFTPNGRTAFYTLSTPSYGRRHTIVYSNFKNGKWSTPEVDSFSGVWSDADPFVSPEGKRL